MWKPLPRTFYARPTAKVARELLGKVIVRQNLAEGGAPRLARIVEVEAYLGERDQASHARRGPTPRAAVMFGPPGHLYCYLIYGMYVCANFVTERDGVAGAVLIRAAADLAGGDPAELRGPGKLCRGLGIGLIDKGLDLTLPTSPLYVTELEGPRLRVARSPRVGVDYAGDWAARPLRFFAAGHPSVSGPRVKTARVQARAALSPLLRPAGAAAASTSTGRRRSRRSATAT
jgi:DNA-3-methyladenine glycosylase